MREARLRWFLHCFAVMTVFAAGRQPDPGAKYDSVSFALQNRIRFLARSRRLASKVRDFYCRPHPTKRFASYGENSTLHPKPFSAVRYFGTGTSFVAAFILLVCVGVFFIRLNRFVICAFLAGLSFFALTIDYDSPVGRYAVLSPTSNRS